MKFIATDGTVFTNRSEYKRYEMETQYTFRNKESTTLIKPIGSISGQPFVISSCKNATILVLDYCDQVQIDDVSCCKIFIAACSESIFLRDCSNCSITVACKQFRTRDCDNCNVYLYCTTDPIIENSIGMKFAPFNGAFEGHANVMKKARLLSNNDDDDDHNNSNYKDTNMLINNKHNQWNKVYDFTPPLPHHTNEPVLLATERYWEIIPKEQQDGTWFISNPFQVDVEVETDSKATSTNTSNQNAHNTNHAILTGSTGSSSNHYHPIGASLWESWLHVGQVRVVPLLKSWLKKIKLQIMFAVLVVAVAVVLTTTTTWTS